jgi:LysM repeat protein
MSPRESLQASMPDSKQEKLSSFMNRRHLLGLVPLAFLGISCQRKRLALGPSYTQEVYYRVKKGDTLYRIAQACSLSMATLMSVNRLYVTELDVGQVLILPNLSKVPHELSQPRTVPDLKTFPLEEPKNRLISQGSQNPRLHIVTRGQWGALTTKSNSNAMGKIKKITLHHTSEYPGMNNLGDKEVIRAIAKYHRDRLDWADIGYHFLIGRDGKIYEGRPAHLQGAHTGGHNENNLGISMVGNFVNKLPSQRQLTALKLLLSSKFQEYGLSTANLYGHRDFKATECPGEALYRWLQVYKFSV